MARKAKQGIPASVYPPSSLSGGTVVALRLRGACCRLLPGEPGYEWNYDVSRTMPPLQGLVTQKLIVRNLRPRIEGGNTYYPKIYANGRTYFYTRSTQGISRRSPGDDGVEQVIGVPLSEGTTWSSTARLQLFDLPKKLEDGWHGLSRYMTMDYTITSLDETVKVPAGHFSRCLRIDAVGFLDLPKRIMLGIRMIKVEQTQWYAPEVGLVKMTRREFAIPNLYPSEYTQVLTSFEQG